MTPIQQVKLMAFGDPEADWLSDEVIEFLLSENGNSIKTTAIESLETLLNQLSLNPVQEESGGYKVWGQNLKFLEKRLTSLKRKSKIPLVPVVINSDRRNFDDIDSIFK